MSVLPNVSRKYLEINMGRFPTKEEWCSGKWHDGDYYNGNPDNFPFGGSVDGAFRWNSEYPKGEEPYATLHESSTYDPETDLYTLRFHIKYADGLVCLENEDVGVPLLYHATCRARLMADAIRTIERRFCKFLYAELIFNVIKDSFDTIDVSAINGIRLNSPLSVDVIFSRIDTHDRSVYVTLSDRVIAVSPSGDIVAELDSAALKEQTTLLNSAKKSGIDKK